MARDWIHVETPEPDRFHLFGFPLIEFGRTYLCGYGWLRTPLSLGPGKYGEWTITYRTKKAEKRYATWSVQQGPCDWFVKSIRSCAEAGS